MEPQTRKTPRGWKRIEKTATAVAAELEEREIAIESDATGWLTLTPAAAAEASDRVAGTLTAAAALSREVCAGCASAGDPVRRADGGLTTRCRDCRAKGDEVLSRGWRAPKREPEAQELEAVIGKAELTALMNAVTPRKNPDRHWPHKIVSGAGVCVSGIGAHGWNHLIRAAYGELVPANGEGGCATIVQIKEKFGGLVIPQQPEHAVPGRLQADDQPLQRAGLHPVREAGTTAQRADDRRGTETHRRLDTPGVPAVLGQERPQVASRRNRPARRLRASLRSMPQRRRASRTPRSASSTFSYRPARPTNVRRLARRVAEGKKLPGRNTRERLDIAAATMR